MFQCLNPLINNTFNFLPFSPFSYRINIPCYVQVNIKIRQGTDGEDTFQDSGCATIGEPCCPGQSYALKAVSDRRLTRTMTANQRNMLSLA